MKKTVLTICLFLALGIAAAQPAPTPMPTQAATAPADKGQVLASHFQSVGKNMRNSASELVISAMGFVGIPYRYGGTSADTGFDCSGFVRAAFERTVGKILPRRAAEQAAVTQQIDRSQLKPGDLVFFNTMRRAFSHVGIYVGDGKFIHSPRTGANIRLDSMDASYWKTRFDGARRVFTENSSLAATMSPAVTATDVSASTTGQSVMQELTLQATQR